MLEIFQMIHRGGYQTFQVGCIKKNCTCWGKTVKFKKAKVVLAEDKEWKNHHQKEENSYCLRSLRKSGAIEDLFYSSKNRVAVKEELAQFNEILKLVEAAHEECKQYMDEEEINNSDKWLDEQDEMILNFKRRCIPGLRKQMRMIDVQRIHQRQRVI